MHIQIATLAAYYFVFGVSDVGARLVSAMFSIVTVVATFELARTLYGRRVAFLAALLLAVSSYSVALGRLALLDSMMTFFFSGRTFRIRPLFPFSLPVITMTSVPHTNAQYSTFSSKV